MKKIKYIILTLLTLCIFFFSNSISVAYASEIISTSGVLEDLEKDENFNASDYISYTYEELETYNATNGTSNDLELINVIQIAESNNLELAIYVYEPTASIKPLNATHINICTDVANKIYNNYDLTLLDRQGVFSKYLVEDFIVDSEALVRYYDISNIYRAYDEALDGVPLETNTINYVGHAVGKLWTAYTNGNTIQYSMEFLEYIEIEISYYGSLRYEQYVGFLHSSPDNEIIKELGIPLLASGSQSTDSHYVCFNTNRQMDELLEAQVYFEITELGSSYSWNTGSSAWQHNPEERNITVTSFETFPIEGGWLHNDYEFGRILTAEEFIKSESDVLDTTSINNINAVINNSSNTAWCLRYCETDYITWASGDSSVGESGVYGIEVNNTSILRLKFNTNGVTYNLGVVDNMTSSDNVPDGIHGIDLNTDEMQEWFEKIIALIGILILVVIIGYASPIFKVVFDIVVTCIKWILKGMLTIITLPFKLIASLFKDK